MWIVARVQDFDFEWANPILPYPVKIQVGAMVGYLPVYETREAAEQDYPDGPFHEIHRIPEPEEAPAVEYPDAFGSIPDAAAARDPVEFLRRIRAGEDPQQAPGGVA